MLIFFQGWINEYDDWRTRELCLYRDRWHLFQHQKWQSKRLVCSLKFTSSSTPKLPKLTQCLEKDREENYSPFFVEFDAS
jgi:hypothetical protein